MGAPPASSGSGRTAAPLVVARVSFFLAFSFAWAAADLALLSLGVGHEPAAFARALLGSLGAAFLLSLLLWAKARPRAGAAT